MKYSFKDILTQEVYDSTRVMLVVGKYAVFNNLVVDTLKDMSVEKFLPNQSLMSLADEFDLGDDVGEEKISTAVDFDTFLEVVNVANINGKWFCNLDLDNANKKQKENLLKYIKSPSRYGILAITSREYKSYKDLLKHKSFLIGQNVHIMQLGFPNKVVLKDVVANMFREKNLYPDNKALELFITRVNTEYDKYLDIINKIEQDHGGDTDISLAEMKGYLRGIEYFDIDDFMYEVVKPISSAKVNNKKIIRMVSSLREKYEVDDLVNKLLVRINEMIDFRILINKGYITVNMRYLFNDVIKLIGEDSKYAKMNEFVFRRRADLAAQTSLNDWTYMKLILTRASMVGFDGSLERKMACEKAIYDLAMRSVLPESRLNNILGIDNILNSSVNRLNSIEFNEEALAEGVKLGLERSYLEDERIFKEKLEMENRLKEETKKNRRSTKKYDEEDKKKTRKQTKNEDDDIVANALYINNLLNGGS